MKLQDYQRLPGFAERAAAVKEDVTDAILRCERVNLGDVARQLGVPLDIAAVWLAIEVAFPLGDYSMSISVINDRKPVQ